MRRMPRKSSPAGNDARVTVPSLRGVHGAVGVFTFWIARGAGSVPHSTVMRSVPWPAAPVQTQRGRSLWLSLTPRQDRFSHWINWRSET